MALSRKTLYFVFAFFFTLAQLPSGCQAGMDYPYSFPGGIASFHLQNAPMRVPGKPCQQLFLGAGEFAVCEPCRLGRGKCRKMCLEDERIKGRCKLNFFCCQKRIL
ncbi:beta-defensin 105 isoform X7 [Lemur catta]|uniref:beta-defensin 105 isoform X7 n=1 Tax=Lemur catta TaxID=9447 RepID=UPI001E26B815|nr:beta-defensin 105 isoform X7 [Lemur catta]